jgi:hypothetical protein
MRKLLFIPFSIAAFYRLTGAWPGEEEPDEV